MADVWLGLYIFVVHIDLEFALGGALGGYWEASCGLEIPPRTLGFTQFNFSPIGFIQPRFVTNFGFRIRHVDQTQTIYQARGQPRHGQSVGAD